MPPRQTTKLDTPSTLVFWWKGPNESLYHIKSESGRTICGLIIPSTSETMVVPNTDTLPRDCDMCQTCKRLAPKHR